MATTVAAYGKVKTKAQRGETMPVGWMMDRQGRPLTDPKRANEGFLLPIGEYKGYGLALIIGLLAGTLNGAAMGRDVVDFNADDTTPTNTGHAIVAISVEAFGERGSVQAQRGYVGARPASFAAPAGRRPHMAARRAEPRQKRVEQRAQWRFHSLRRWSTISLGWRQSFEFNRLASPDADMAPVREDGL